MVKLARLVGFAFAILTLAAVFIFGGGSSVAQADDDHGDYRTQATALEIGSERVTGEIDFSSIPDVDYFSFEANRGTRYTFLLEFVTVQNANILVVNSIDRGVGSSPGQVITNGDGQKTVEWIARTTDTYFLEISGFVNGTVYLGSYAVNLSADPSLDDRHSESLFGASPIEVDNVYLGAISPWTNQPGLADSKQGGDDHDYFVFQSSRGVKYTVNVDLGTAGGVEISIVRPNGGTETSNGAVGTSLEWIAPSSSSYYIVLSGSSRFPDSIGTYSLKLSADTTYLDKHSQTIVGATPLNFGNALQGAISPEDDRDVFSFQAVRGERYEIRATLGTAQGIEISVEGPGGDLVASNVGVGSKLEWIAPANGLYHLVAAGSTQVRDPVGTYSVIVDAEVSLADRHSESVTEATPVNFGNELQGAISPPNDRDYFAFEARRGVIYSISVTLGTVEGVEITLVKPDGSAEVSNGGVGTSLDWTAPSADTYYVAITAPTQVSNPIGTYSLKLEANESLEDKYGGTRNSATQVTAGSVYQASISPEGDVDYFAFRASRGVEYTFELNYGTAAAVSLSVDKVEGRLGAAARNFGEGTDVIWIAPDNDQYFVVISGSPRVLNPTGTYSLQIRADTALADRHSGLPNEATRIILGNAIAGAISPADDVDYFYIDAVEGTEYATVVELGTAGAIRVSITHALAGFAASNYDDGTKVEWRAPITGRFLVAVTGLEQAAVPVGTYQLSIVNPDDLPVPTPEPTSAAPPTPAPTPTPIPVALSGPGLIVESRQASPGTTVLVPIVLQEAEDLASLGFTFSYDASVVELVNVMKGARLAPATFSYNDGIAGAVRFGFAATMGLSGDGSAAVLEFKVIGEQGSSSMFTLAEVLAIDSGGGRLELQLLNGQLTVEQPMTGDGNGDGRITAIDALIALRVSLQLSPESLALDVNGDGEVTQEDAWQILNMARPE